MLQGAVLTTADSNTAEDSVDEINDSPINGTCEVDNDADDARQMADDAGGVGSDILVVGGISIALELPTMTFYREEQWNCEPNFSLNMLEPSEAVRPTAESTTSMLLAHLLQHLNDLGQCAIGQCSHLKEKRQMSCNSRFSLFMNHPFTHYQASPSG
ncbi:hypothetical protein EDD21DRAFT_432599 [Dissophora ornata]|nr:hypothetical protein EDD21DRAFT_432599 [Dissophora ornata]